MSELPAIRKVSKIAETRIFRIESVDLEFSNGVQCQYERLNKRSAGAVMVMPIIDHSLVLVREYAVGAERYELGFVKGLIEPGESSLAAADRELKEEIGFGANSIREIRKTRLIPHYNSAVAYLMLAEDLYAERHEGDEPEEMEQIRWPLDDLTGLLAHQDISDVRTLHGIYWLRDNLPSQI